MLLNQLQSEQGNFLKLQSNEVFEMSQEYVYATNCYQFHCQFLQKNKKQSKSVSNPFASICKTL